METYTFLRELADSWVLLAMTLFYLGAILWVLNPARTPEHRDAANIPFRDDPAAAPCSKDCANCACKTIDLETP